MLSAKNIHCSALAKRHVHEIDEKATAAWVGMLPEVAA